MSFAVVRDSDEATVHVGDDELRDVIEVERWDNIIEQMPDEDEG